MTLILESSGERAGIEELWERYSSTPESMHFMVLAEQLRRRGCQGEAVEICSRAKASRPGYVSCRVLLGRCLMELGLKDEGLRELEAVLELDRENAFSLRVMAELRLSQGNLPEAANYYRALVRINPADLEMQEKLAEAVKALESAGSDTDLRSGQEAVVRSIAVRPQELSPQTAVEGIESAVERALEELRTSEATVPAWHMEDRPAGRATSLPPSKPAEPREKVRATVSPGTPSFNYSDKQSDFSTFVQWVMREKGGLGAKPGATNG